MLQRKKQKVEIIKPGWEGFRFPKKKRIRVDPKQPETPEKTIQAMTDIILQTSGISYLRLPDHMFKSIYFNRAISPRLKAWILHELSGWADNIAFIPLNDKFCLACMIENKTASGRLHGKQKQRARELPYNIVRSDKEAKQIVRGFKAFAERVKQLIGEE